LGVLASRVQMDNLPFTTALRSAASVVAAWSFLLAGLVTWRRRPGNRLGPLMVAVCFALLARQFRYSHDDLAFTVFFLLGELPFALIANVAFAFPSGRVTDRLERAFVIVTYVVAVAFPLAILLFDDGQRLRYFDPVPRTSAIVLRGNDDVVDFLQDTYAVVGYGILAGLFVVLVARKLLNASSRARRIYWPLLFAAVAAALRAVLDSIFSFVTVPLSVTVNLFWWQVAALTALPLALLWVLLRARLARSHVGELVVHLEETSPSDLRDELAVALEDPSLELGLWLPERREYVDAYGNRVEVTDDGPTRAVTLVEHEGEPLAMLAHDATLR